MKELTKGGKTSEIVLGVALAGALLLAGAVGYLVAPGPSPRPAGGTERIIFQANVSQVNGSWVGLFNETANSSDLLVLSVWFHVPQSGCGWGSLSLISCSYWLNGTTGRASSLARDDVTSSSSAAGQLIRGPLTFTARAQVCAVLYNPVSYTLECGNPLVFDLSIKLVDMGPAPLAS